MHQLADLIVIEHPQKLKQYRKSRRFMKSHYFKKLLNKNLNLNCSLIDKPELQSFFNSFNKSNADAQNIIQSLREYLGNLLFE